MEHMAKRHILPELELPHETVLNPGMLVMKDVPISNNPFNVLEGQDLPESDPTQNA